MTVSVLSMSSVAKSMDTSRLRTCRKMPGEDSDTTRPGPEREKEIEIQ
jgi:hypothetical protein